MISAPSKPLKLKLAGHILYGETRLRTKGFCSAPLRSRDIRDKVRNGILTLFRDQLYFSTTKQRRTKSFGTHVHNTSNDTSTKLQLQRIKLYIEIINLKPVTPTTILLRVHTCSARDVLLDFANPKAPQNHGYFPVFGSCARA